MNPRTTITHNGRKLSIGFEYYRDIEGREHYSLRYNRISAQGNNLGQAISDLLIKIEDEDAIEVQAR